MENLNTTMNGTQPQNCYPSYLSASKIGQAFACCLFLVVSPVGNTFIAIIIYKTKTMRTTTNYFILNMAISDLLFPILVFPSSLIEMYEGFWFFSGERGQAFCKVMLFIQYVSSLVSIENLVLIAVDRFGAIVFPFRRPFFGSKLCLFFILTTWLAASALPFPVFFGYKSVEYTGRFQNCAWVQKGNFFADKYLRALPFFVMVGSFALIVFLYSLILFKLKSQKPPGEQSVNAVRQREKRERNVLRVAVAIVTGFVVCWGPSTTITLLSAFVWDNSLPCESAAFWLMIRYLTYGNCALNLCICFAFSGKYRQGLKGLLGFH